MLQRLKTSGSNPGYLVRSINHEDFPKFYHQNGWLYMMPKGVTLNPNGRPRKWISKLKEQGYTQSQVNDCIRVMLDMTVRELNNVQKDENADILERTVARALLKSLSDGTLDSIETLLNRTFGKPRESHDHRINHKMEFEVTLKRKDNAYQDNVQ